MSSQSHLSFLQDVNPIQPQARRASPSHARYETGRLLRRIVSHLCCNVLSLTFISWCVAGSVQNFARKVCCRHCSSRVACCSCGSCNHHARRMTCRVRMKPGNIIHRDKMQYNVPPFYGLQQPQAQPTGYPSSGYFVQASGGNGQLPGGNAQLPGGNGQLPGGNGKIPAGIIQPQVGPLLLANPPGMQELCRLLLRAALLCAKDLC